MKYCEVKQLLLKLSLPQPAWKWQQMEIEFQQTIKLITKITHNHSSFKNKVELACAYSSVKLASTNHRYRNGKNLSFLQHDKFHIPCNETVLCLHHRKADK